MKFVFVISVVLLHLCGVSFCAEGNFFFRDQANWATDDNDCGKEENSPIDIITKDVFHDSMLDEPFTWSENFLEDIEELNCKNTGQSYTCTLGDTATARKMEGGNLIKTPMRLLQFHVHFGSSERMEGSEHRVDGHQYPAEIHFVFVSEDVWPDKFSSYGDLAVWGFFIDVTSNSYAAQGSLDTVLTKIAGLVNYEENGAGVDVDNEIDLSEIIPVVNYHAMGSFYRYKGGLTTPGCNQLVQWTVFKDPLYISEEQYKRMTGGKTWPNSDSQVENMVDTFRRPQPLNGRPVSRTAFAGEGMTDGDSDASVDSKASLGSSAALALLSVAVSKALLH